MISEELYKAYAAGECAITCGGYTYLNEGGHSYYCAAGTFPGCLRGCAPITLEQINSRDRDWQRLGLKDLFKRKGFYPNAFMLGIVCRLQSHWDEYDFSIQDMIDHCMEYGSVEWKNDFVSRRVWDNYFTGLGL